MLKAFCASIEIIMCFLSLILFMWWITFLDLHYVESALHPRDEAYLIVVDKLFEVLFQSVCQYFIEVFCIYVHHGYWPDVFFSCWVSADFWNQYDVGLIKWFVLFGIVSEGMVPAPLFMSGRIYLWTHLGLGSFWLVGY